jgi:hypothetical protein
MQKRITETYQELARRTEGGRAPVGSAWQVIRRSHPEIELYLPDGSHPSRQGTYLAACVFVATLFGASPRGAPTFGLIPAEARALQEVAEAVVLGRPSSTPGADGG